ncbi:hypothetical protein [Microvirga soli]|uniref:hypothetical protein n=1 Tax=Microvirga soli TaxID=1854496 RepID=UPI00191F8D73|nr:hypothetical protein [Microvirga soli]
MRYSDFAPTQTSTFKKRLRTVTLYVLDDAEWALLTKIRKATGPSRIIAVRSLAPRYQGFSVDVLCKDVDAAWELFANFHDHSFRKLCHDAAYVN